jgi:hypothetical protein
VTRRGNQTDYELPDSESITYNPGFDDNGSAPERDPLLIPGRNQDLSQREKTTLGNYLNNLTSGRVGTSRPNSFTVPGGSSSTDGSGHSVSTDASSNQGSSLTLSQMRSAGSTNGTFTDLTQGLNRSAVRKFQDTKNSEYGRGQSPFKDTDIKNFDSESRRRSQDGNSLLTSIQSVGEGPSPLGSPRVGEPPETAPLVQKKISEVIRTNRFNPIDKPFVQDKSRTDTGYTVQKQLGKYDPNAYTVSESGLASVGINVMLSAAGIPNGKNFVPGLAMIDTADMRAQSVDVSGAPAGLSNAPGDAEGELLLKNLAPYKSFGSPDYTKDSSSRSSYGNMNSPIEPFSSMSSFSDTKNLAILTAAVLSVNGLVALIEKKSTSPDNRVPGTFVGSGRDFAFTPGYELDLGRRRLKSNRENDTSAGDLFILSSIGKDFLDKFVYAYRLAVPETEYAFSDCILRGISIFVDEVRIGSSGYIGALSRNISLGTYSSIVSTFSGIASSFTTVYNLASQKNALSATTSAFSSVEQSLSALNNFFNSRLFRFIAVLAQIGDKSLISDREKLERSEGYGVDQPSVQASRFSDYNMGPDWRYDIGSQDPKSLAWKHSSSPSMYILPPQLRSAIANYAAVNTKFVGLETDSRKRLDSNSYQIGRIGAGKVKEIEDHLESEYMPFYFHDIRTNEIISFHAFLADLSDGFTASYESTPGYGRSDEIMTYKSTKRSIGLSFYVISTSPEDLDVMYWNINKLVSMLYPQYSRGRAMKSGNDRFIQPFSQIPTASPLIRLRIGDIVKSNYSKFGIARLFGLGQPESVFSPKPIMAASQVVEQPTQGEPTAVPPPAPPPPGPFSVGQVITIKRGIPTRNRFLDSSYESIETARSRLSTQQDPAVQNADTATITRANTNVPVIRGALRSIPRGTKARIIKIEVVDGKPRYKCDIIRLGITSRVTTRTVEVASTPVLSDRTSSYDSSLYYQLQSRDPSERLQDPITFDPYQYSNYSLPAGPDGSMSVMGQEQLITTGGQSIAGPSTRTNLLPSIGLYHYIDLAENEIVRPRVRVSRENSESAASTDDEASITPRVPVAPAAPAPNALNLSEFLSSDADKGNPVIKSFETTLGRGLAGFITDIKFDWNESTWEIDNGIRAPKFMKVNISFSPIHDIPMGLDSDLAMRSVAYNVGGLSKTIGDDVY